MLLKLLWLCTTLAVALELPESCKTGQYYNPGLMSCASCNANVSLVTSDDGFGCKCEANSVSVDAKRCKRCSATELVSADGSTCVPRRCQKDSAGRLACRKCPENYIAVTQNYDGSPMREVQCVKCLRGYKATDNRCIKCNACACPRDHLVISDACVPKPFVMDRPKYEEGLLHPNRLLDVVKFEHFCTLGDARACSILANACVRSSYSSDRGSACRLWLKSSTLPRPPDLPPLVFDPFSIDGKKPGEIQLSSKTQTITLAVAAFNGNGGLLLVREPRDSMSSCLLPKTIRIGKNVATDCNLNITNLGSLDLGESLSPYLNLNGDFQPLPVSIRKPTGYVVQSGEWATNKFRRYFLMDTLISGVTNATSTVYLRTLTTFLRIKREKTKSGLSIQVSLEAQYATKSALSDSITITFNVVNELPSAGVLKGLEYLCRRKELCYKQINVTFPTVSLDIMSSYCEDLMTKIWGGLLGALLSLYAIVQWRGSLRRGGLYTSLLPIMSGSIADALYFAALFSTLHALAAEAGNLGLTLPLGHGEDHIVSAFIYSALSLKIVKVAWVNWKQIICDIFLLDWSYYNSPQKEIPVSESNINWNKSMVAREWSLMQTKRRVSPGYTVTLTLVLSHFMSPWRNYLPASRSYQWALASLPWWLAYAVLLLWRWLKDKLFGAPSAVLPKACSAAGVSLLVFQEENYAHYVHGRNDDSPDARALLGHLANCRVMCAPQLRVVYKQLSMSESGALGDLDAKRALLSRFLAAFFERALDGMSWVACERTLLERLLDVEVTARESTTTSALLYDDDPTPSCFALTWWGEEWSLSTAEAMVFGCVVVAGGDILLASLVALLFWQVSLHLRSWLGDRNLKRIVDCDPLV